MLRIRYTLHVRRRMAQRGVREVDIEVTLSSPSNVCQTPEPSWRYERTMSDGRTLRVWTVDEVSESTVVVVKSTAWKGPE